MLQRLKYVISLILTGLILFNAMGYYLLVPAMHLIHQQRVFSNVRYDNEKKVLKITINKSGKNQSAKRLAKEIMLNGKYYDVIQVADNGYSLTYSCIPDYSDDRLLKTYADSSEDTKSALPVKKDTSEVLGGIIKTALVEENICLAAHSFAISLQSDILLSYSAPYLSTPCQPPQFS